MIRFQKTGKVILFPVPSPYLIIALMKGKNVEFLTPPLSLASGFQRELPGKRRERQRCAACPSHQLPVSETTAGPGELCTPLGCSQIFILVLMKDRSCLFKKSASFPPYEHNTNALRKPARRTHSERNANNYTRDCSDFPTKRPSSSPAAHVARPAARSGGLLLTSILPLGS